MQFDAVQKAIASKRITLLADGTIDSERANQEWAKNTFAGQTIREAIATPERLPPMCDSPGPTGDPVTAYLRARAVKENLQARTAELEYKQRAGKLIEATRASEYAASFSAIRQGWADGDAGSPDSDARRSGRRKGDSSNAVSRDFCHSTKNEPSGCGRAPLNMQPFSIQQVGAAAMLPPRDITVAKWADESRVLTGGAAAERLRLARQALRNLFMAMA